MYKCSLLVLNLVLSLTESSQTCEVDSYQMRITEKIQWELRRQEQRT